MSKTKSMKYTLRSLMIVVTLICVVLGGVLGRIEYPRRTGESQRQGVTGELERQEIKEIAKKEARSRSGWSGELKVDLVETKSGWNATVSRLPAMPGGHAYVKISTAKKVTGYSNGL
jgi:hypothetical protein